MSAAGTLYKKHGEKVRFGLVGVINTALDLVLYGVLANVFSMPVVAANMISTGVCMAVSFLLNYNFVWESKKTKRETAPRFVLVSLFSAWVVQSGVIWLVVAWLGDGSVVAMLAKVLGVGCGMVTNYLGYKVVFRK